MVHHRVDLRPTPLVGRAAELRALVDALEHHRGIVVVEGEPGIGKTRLIGEALAAADLAGRPVLSGEAHPVGQPFPLGPIVDALVRATLPATECLTPAVGALRGYIPERADELPPPLEPLEDPRAQRERVLEGVVDLLTRLDDAVLVLEDLHWVDDRTVELLGRLSALSGFRLLVVMSYRPLDVAPDAPLRRMLDATPPGVTLWVRLEALSESEVAELATRLLDSGSVPKPLARRLTDRTGGVPFVIEEDIRFLRSRDFLLEEAGV